MRKLKISGLNYSKTKPNESKFYFAPFREPNFKHIFLSRQNDCLNKALQRRCKKILLRRHLELVNSEIFRLKNSYHIH